MRESDILRSLEPQSPISISSPVSSPNTQSSIQLENIVTVPPTTVLIITGMHCSGMYIGHLWGVKREIFEQLGGFRIGFEGVQDYDFALRATEICHQIAHLPLILYH